MREFLGVQNLDNVLAVGFSQGAPFAFAASAQGGVKALAIRHLQDINERARLMVKLSFC
jgi:dienelactone hydrolase